jgi:hypothetical protein
VRILELDPPDPGAMCVQGNPNALTFYLGTSKLGAGSLRPARLVRVKKWAGPLPPDLPPIERRPGL